jgi:toxin ParE1/3/4
MDFKIVWLPRGIETLQELIEYFSGENPDAAHQMGEAIFQKIQLLARQPHLGRVFTKPSRQDIRETPVPPYRVIYRVQVLHNTITILTVWHGARKEPEIL